MPASSAAYRIRIRGLPKDVGTESHGSKRAKNGAIAEKEDER
jgi:hypothetical protein